jgi:hypothetical protein
MAPQLPLDLERDLFAAALDMRRAEPWRRLFNNHYLLVAGPGGGRRALTVLGNGGQQYGLHCYAASCAAHWLVLVEDYERLNLASSAIIYEILEGLELEFTTKAELDKEDLARAKRCNYQPPPRTRQAWPRFRAFRPNRFPWHLDEPGARLLRDDLRRAVRWAELAPTLPWPDLERPIALRKLPVVAAELPTDRPWTEADLTWERLVVPPVPEVPRVALDPARAAGWRARPLDPQIKIMVDERAPLMRIADEAGGAPYFPRVGLCLDKRTGIILGQHMGSADQPFGFNAMRALAIALEALDCRPAVVLFVNPNLPKALASWLHAADLRAELSEIPPELEEIWTFLQ